MKLFQYKHEYTVWSCTGQSRRLFAVIFRPILNNRPYWSFARRWSALWSPAAASSRPLRAVLARDWPNIWRNTLENLLVLQRLWSCRKYWNCRRKCQSHCPVESFFASVWAPFCLTLLSSVVLRTLREISHSLPANISPTKHKQKSKINLASGSFNHWTN